MAILSLSLIQVGSCQLLAKGLSTSFSRLCLSLHRKTVVRLTDHLDMTIDFDLDFKPQINQPTKSEYFFLFSKFIFSVAMVINRI